MINFCFKFLSIFFLFISFVAGSDIKNKQMSWPFRGILGKFDKQAAQRGFQVYKEVCSTCHSMNQLSYRKLSEIGFSLSEVKEIAKQYTIKDGPNDSGDMFDRPRTPSDKFAPPYLNEQAARFANGGAYPVDLSLIIKARHDGPNYVYSLLTGYEDPPKNFQLMSGLYYNKYFPGQQIAMPPPLIDGIIKYSDNTQASIEQMARDVTIFLQWASEPEMEHRKWLGLKSMIFLIIFTVLFIIAKNRIWARLK